MKNFWDFRLGLMEKEHSGKESNYKIFTSVLDQERTNNKLRILVVDDNEDVRNILNKFLSRRGHNVKAVDNGTEAIRLSMSVNFDLVLTDLKMPNVTGNDVIKALKGLNKSPKIGLVTARSEEFNPVESGNLSVDFVVKKPFKLSEIEKNINDIFE